MDKTIVFGASGQVGRALKTLIGDAAIPIGRDAANLSVPSQIPALLDRLAAKVNITAVVNAAAYTAVDRAEQEENTARMINAESPGLMARWCATRQIPFIHYSTDYVFSGEGTRPWIEEDPVGPLSAYGRTKLEGERAIVEAGGRFLIFRTSWIYDAYGKNFVRTMLKLGKEREKLRVVSDQHGAPTYAPHLARASLHALRRSGELSNFPAGIYHISNLGETTWHEFALHIFERAQALGFKLAIKEVAAISSAEYPTPARRPVNSRLSLSKALNTFNVTMPGWREGLAECMEILRANPEFGPECVATQDPT